MIRKIVKYLVLPLALLGFQGGLMAQEEAVPAPRKLSKKEAQVEKAKAQARAKRVAAKAKAEAAAQAKAVDLNRASKQDLMKLQGITEAMADAIIAQRPYRSKADLVTRKIIPMGTYQSLRKQIAAK